MAGECCQLDAAHLGRYRYRFLLFCTKWIAVLGNFFSWVLPGVRLKRELLARKFTMNYSEEIYKRAGLKAVNRCENMYKHYPSIHAHDAMQIPPPATCWASSFSTSPSPSWSWPMVCGPIHSVRIPIPVPLVWRIRIRITLLSSGN